MELTQNRFRAVRAPRDAKADRFVVRGGCERSELGASWN